MKYAKMNIGASQERLGRPNVGNHPKLALPFGDNFDAQIEKGHPERPPKIDAE